MGDAVLLYDCCSRLDWRGCYLQVSCFLLGLNLDVVFFLWCLFFCCCSVVCGRSYQLTTFGHFSDCVTVPAELVGLWGC